MSLFSAVKISGGNTYFSLKFSPSYKRIRIAYIDAARKRAGEFEKRLANFIKKTKENKQIGFGGIEKYYPALEKS